MDILPRILIGTVIVNLAMFLGISGMVQLLFNGRFVRLTFQRTSILKSLVFVGLGVFALVLISVSASIITSGVLGNEEMNQTISLMVDYFNSPLGLIVIGPVFMLFAAGIPEEVLRAYVLSFAVRKGNETFASYTLLLVSAVFAIGHLYQGVSAVIQIFPVGLFLGWYYLRRRNIWENVWVHTLYNSTALFLETMNI